MNMAWISPHGTTHPMLQKLNVLLRRFLFLESLVFVGILTLRPSEALHKTFNKSSIADYHFIAKEGVYLRLLTKLLCIRVNIFFTVDQTTWLESNPATTELSSQEKQPYFNANLRPLVHSIHHLQFDMIYQDSHKRLANVFKGARRSISLVPSWIHSMKCYILKVKNFGRINLRQNIFGTKYIFAYFVLKNIIHLDRASF